MELTFLEVPKTCPRCGRPTTIKVDPRSLVKTLWCTNTNCGESNNQKLAHFVSRDAMNIVGMSEETIRDLVSAEVVETIADIIKLPSMDYNLEVLEGWGLRKKEKLYESIESSKNVKLENFVYALGIPNVGLQTAKVIAKYCNYDLDIFRKLTWYDMMSINGIGDVIAASIDEWLSDQNNQDDIDEMIYYGLNIIGVGRTSGSRLAGKVFCCTGALHHFESRTELKNYIESQGGKLTGSVSNNTDYLITNDTTSGSAKNRAAASLGISVITEQEFIDMFVK
jgi:DNA ligase (NAD+)